MDTSHENRERASHAHLPRVVIVGGGFGGLYAARGLARAPVTVTVVDKHNYHLFRPMLYQVATGLLSSDEVAAPIRSILRRQKNVTVLMAEVVGVDPHARVVFTREGTVAYDYLVLATGIEYNYFGHEEWKALAPGLASVDDADRIRGKILTAFESAEQLAASGKADASILHELLTFVQVGAGTAGVEMAGTMAEMARMALAEDFRHIDPRSAHILLFEAAPRILPTYPEGLSEKARRHLEGLGVEVHTNAKVERVDEHGVIVNGERIASRTVLWTAGVVASPAGRWLGVDVDRAGRIKVNPDLSVPGHPNVFAVGDTAAITADTRSLFGIRSETPELLPGVAQVAIQGGRYVAKPHPAPSQRRALREAVLVLGQGKHGDRGPDVCRGGPQARALLRIHGVASVGRHPHLLPDRVCESAVGDAAVGDIVRHEATWGSDSSTRPTPDAG